MARLVAVILFLGCTLFAQQQPSRQQPAQQEPPEEDEGLAKTEYSFNPLQAEKELKVGEFYAKKGSWKAASNRFREATRWNPGLAEAWLRLGDAEEKLHSMDEARKAWATALKLEPGHARAKELEKKIAKNQPKKAAKK